MLSLVLMSTTDRENTEDAGIFEHQRLGMVYGLVFYVMLTVVTNLYLWSVSGNRAYVCS